MTRTIVAICTPAFFGKVNASFACSLAETVKLLDRKGINTELYIPQSGSLLCQERNRLIKAFLKSPCTHILCIDSDIAWMPEIVIQMLQADKDFLAACYSARSENVFLFKPLYNEDKSLKTNGKFIEMRNIPSGFMLIKRHVIEKIIEDTPEDKIIPSDKTLEPFHCIFETKKIDNEFWGEDFIFCDKVRASGFDILVDPTIVLDHDGRRAALIQTLTDDKEKSAHHQEPAKV